KKDIRDLALIRDIHKFNQLLEILASQSGQLLNVAELSNTCGLAKQTIEHYLFLLEATYILKRIVPYSKNLRSELFKTPKVFFYDTGLMQMFWFKGLQKEILGSVFETSVFSELVKKYGVENISFWRTTDKKEIDFILRQKETVLPIEVKLQLAQFQPTAIHYFSKKYSIKKYKVVYLKGEPKHDCDIVPWQL
ncbi:MAG: DUF4143 domain-containing protein, partial [Deltaproteobacteria bacterium]|nr:DUF4143 domain-containing protein [Deltaproteobacteria bacterium]